MNNRTAKITLYSIVAFAAFSSPVYANVPLGWGMHTAIAPYDISKSTYGLAAIAVIAIEAFILKRYLKIKWVYAVLTSILVNIISTGLGFFLTGTTFMGFFSLIALVICPPLIWLILTGLRASYFIRIFLTLSYIAGMFICFWGGWIPLNTTRFQLWLIVEFSLLVGLPLTVISEAFFVNMFTRNRNTVQAVFVANLYSYIVLVVLFPFFAPNIYGVNFSTEYIFRLYIEDKNSEDTSLRIRKLHDNMQYLLGLRTDNPHPDDYEPYAEVDALETAVVRHYPPDVACLIARETNSYSPFDFSKIQTKYDDMSRQEQEYMKIDWFEKYYTYFLDAKTVEASGDQEKLEKVLNEWSAWYEANKYPDADIYTYEYSGWKSVDVNPRDMMKREEESID